MTFKRANQLILMITDGENGRYSEESDYTHKVFETIADFAATINCEEYVQFFRIDTKTAECEDITPEFLDHWLAGSPDILEMSDDEWPKFIPENVREYLIEDEQDEAVAWAKGPDDYYGTPARI